MTTINSNGSKWAGESPDSIAALIERLKQYPLAKWFQDFGNFIIKGESGLVTFFGNFSTVSAVFNIDTDDEATIEKLWVAIRLNQLRPDYISQ